MTSRVSAPVRIWRTRHARSRGDSIYLAYMTLMVALVAIVPLVRAVSVGITSAEAVALLTAPTAQNVTTLATAGIWAFSLLLGRVRGPALRPPFLTHALASSKLPRAVSFRGPLLTSGATAVALTTMVGGLISASLVSATRSTPSDALIFVLASTCVGIISTIAWLVGQAMPRTAAVLAPTVFALGVIASAIPALQPFTPWGWVGLAHPVASATGSLTPLLALTAVAVAVAPALMNRITLTQLTSQALRWESATSYAAGLELAAATSVYQSAPTVGRHLCAVRPALRRPFTFLLRDAVGAARTPIRLAAAILALVASATLLMLSLSAESPNWALGAVAGVILFAGLGPLTDGIRHAASVASDLPLYGISDEQLLAHHVLFPALTTITMLVLTTVICALLTGHAIPGVLGSLTLGTLAIAARIGSALKGPLPPALLTPIPTPLGDLGAVVRLTWALDGLLLTALAGASAVLTFQSPLLLASVGAALTGLTIHRWRHRV